MSDKKPEGKSDEKKPEPLKNLHIEVPESFHRRIKMLCVMKSKTLKEYAFEALQEKVAKDDKEMRK